MARTKQPNIGGGLLTARCDYLALGRHFFWRSNVPVYDFSIGKYRKPPPCTMKGIPDICLIRDGRFIGIEAKAGSGRLSKGQAEFRRLCITAGGEYALAEASRMCSAGL